MLKREIRITEFGREESVFANFCTLCQNRTIRSSVKAPKYFAHLVHQTVKASNFADKEVVWCGVEGEFFQFFTPVKLSHDLGRGLGECAHIFGNNKTESVDFRAFCQRNHRISSGRSWVPFQLRSLKNVTAFFWLRIRSQTSGGPKQSEFTARWEGELRGVDNVYGRRGWKREMGSGSWMIVCILWWKALASSARGIEESTHHSFQRS